MASKAEPSFQWIRLKDRLAKGNINLVQNTNQYYKIKHSMEIGKLSQNRWKQTQIYLKAVRSK